MRPRTVARFPAVLVAFGLAFPGALVAQCVICDPGDDPPVYGVRVTPDGSSFGIKPTSSGGHTLSFTVKNTGNHEAESYNLSCSGTNGISCSPSTPSIAVSPGTSTTVTVTFSTGSTIGDARVNFSATSSRSSNSGYYTGRIERFRVSVTPDDTTAPQREAHTGTYSQTFTIKNTGTISNTFSFDCIRTGGVTCGPDPSSLTLAAGETRTRSQTYSVGSPGSGTLKLKATGSHASNSGYYTVPIVTYAVKVTPDGQIASTHVAHSTSHSKVFTIQNTGTGTETFDLVCTGSGGVDCGSALPSVQLTGGQTVTRTQPYRVGGAGTGTLTLTATSARASNAGSYSIPVVAYGVAVTAIDPARTLTENTEGHLASFSVRNTGSEANTYTFSCSSSARVICGAAPSDATLDPGEVATVEQSFEVGEPGTGTLTLAASGPHANDSDGYGVTIAQHGFASVAAGAFSMGSGFMLVETAVAYDSAGRITKLADGRGNATRYEYGGNSRSAFLTRVIREHDGTGSVDLVTTLGYDPAGNLESIDDEGGTQRRFTYDGFGRLRRIGSDSGTTLRAYGYTYSPTAGSGWSFAATDSTFFEPGQGVIRAGFFDGLGRPIQDVEAVGSSSIVTAIQYDNAGRPWRTWKPYPWTGSGYDAGFAGHATDYYNGYHSPLTTHPYVETQYAADPLERVEEVVPEFTGAVATHATTYDYGVDTGGGLVFTDVADETGRTTRTYSDLFGNVVRTVLGHGSPDATTTRLEHDVLGRRTRATDPRGLVTTYSWNGRGLLTERTSPDAGTVRHAYDAAGNRRFTQDANQAAAGQVLFTTYDFAGRPLVSGLASAAFSGLDPDATESFETNPANFVVVRAYDTKPATLGVPWSLFGAQIDALTLTNVTGRLAAVASKSNGSWQATLFSYDADGHVQRRYTYTHGNGTTTVLAALSTRTTYVRNLQGAITQRIDSIGAGVWTQWYEYDGRGRLSKVFASTGSTKPATPDVVYTHRPSGQIESRQFAGGPAVPLRYTIREQLERIGDPASTAYPFSAAYAYHPNGTVASTDFYNAGSPAVAKRYRYVFGTARYDALNRLKGADFSSWSGTGWTGTSAHDLAGITYDLSGNITALARYRETGTVIDNLAYAYTAGTNRLGSISDAIGGSAEAWDAESGSFTYDANGNMTTAPSPYSISAARYDHRNLPLSITSGGTTTAYRYNEQGQRVVKQVGTGNAEYYVLDGFAPIGVVTVNGSGTPTAWHFNVLADSGRVVVGRQPSSGGRLHYHTDLLGSTRAVVQGGSVVEAYDFDPWGMCMPGRALAGATKEGFTTKERDAETGLDYFGFRHYMPALGRWSSVDPPADSFPEWSPYNYVEGNPVTYSDPFGLCPECEEGDDGQRPREGFFNRLVHGTYESCEAGNNADCSPSVVQLSAPLVTPGGGPLKLLRPGSRLGKLFGRTHPQKIGAGGRLQPYDAATGRYLSPADDLGLAESPAAQFTIGFGQGFGSAQTGVEAPVSVTKAQTWGQSLGRILGTIFN